MKTKKNRNVEPFLLHIRRTKQSSSIKGTDGFLNVTKTPRG